MTERQFFFSPNKPISGYGGKSINWVLQLVNSYPEKVQSIDFFCHRCYQLQRYRLISNMRSRLVSPTSPLATISSMIQCTFSRLHSKSSSVCKSKSRTLMRCLHSFSRCVQCTCHILEIGVHCFYGMGVRERNIPTIRTRHATLPTQF